MSKKILITGASGFTGKHAVQHFLGKGYTVHAVTRHTKLDIDHKTVHIHSLDLSDKAAVHALLENTKPDYILHLAGENSVPESWKTPFKSWQANVDSTLHLVEAVRALGLASRVVIAGSVLQDELSSAASPTHPYSLTKTMQTTVGLAWHNLFQVDVMIAKPSNIIGPGVSNGVCTLFAKQLRQLQASGKSNFQIGNAAVTRDFIDVRDLVAAYETLFLNGTAGETYEITSGRWVSLGEILSLLRRVSNFDFTIQSETEEAMEMKLPMKSEKIRALTWKPTRSLETSLADVWEYTAQQ
ncbi:NAD-dependent epimerase/dehydratase family protein [Terribacillus saccharophilus]|uniref:NAD-dependent epimerase/dehydratase family protein n=1 Tax=Terribacillus saccharophilus TaxID=361277 RepID=UPI00298A03C8|nr:NAD-dependent epimerase/dehydratase family protein [Terribacillus saccharophilus]MCM3225579.1 GDP-mannose 4,6-dehydratase [Terribacillus saccharophilus]